MKKEGNFNSDVIHDFGNEWGKFNQESLETEETEQIFRKYFKIFPWERVNESACGFDLGCGSGRWARLVAPKVGKLYCIEPSEQALNVARKNLKNFNNIEFAAIIPSKLSSTNFNGSFIIFFIGYPYDNVF